MAKHKNLKRALSLLLALCFVMSFFTVALADEAEEFGYDETVQDDTAIEGGVFDPGDEADQDASEAEDNDGDSVCGENEENCEAPTANGNADAALVNKTEPVDLEPIRSVSASAVSLNEAGGDESDVEPANEGKTRTTGELTVSGAWPAAGDTSYVMNEAPQKGFMVNYNAEGAQDIIIVVECLEYGAQFATVPNADSGEGISEVCQLDAHTVAMRLSNTDQTITPTATFTMVSASLTSAQIAFLMANGMQTTRIAATEYTWNGDIADYKQGVKGTEAILWEGYPAYDPEATVAAANLYAVGVSPISSSSASMTDTMLAGVGYYGSSGGSCYNENWQSGEPRFQLPAVYDEDGSLMEIVSVRVYAPDNKLYLKSLGNTNTFNDYRSMGRCLDGSDFDQQWGNWTISGPFEDEAGHEYYDLTPKTPCFNTNSNHSDYYYHDWFFGGMVLTWKLKDPGDPLEADTVYSVENGTIVEYRLPGDGDNTRTVSFAGPKIRTYKVVERTIEHGYYSEASRGWDKDTDANHNVVIGSLHEHEKFNYVKNSSYFAPSTLTHYIPADTQGMTQTYTFPYQIEPSEIDLYESNQARLNSTVGRSVLASVTYETYSGATGGMSEEDVAAINAKLATFSNTGNDNAPKFLGKMALPAHVKTVTIVWTKFGTDLRWGHPTADTGYTCYTEFTYTVNDWEDETEQKHLPEYTWVQVRYEESYANPEMETYVPPTVKGPNNTSRANIYKEKFFWFRLKKPVDPDLYGVGQNGKDETRALNSSGSTYSFPIKLLDDGEGTLGKVGFIVDNYGQRVDYIDNPQIVFGMSQSQQYYDTNWSEFGNGTQPRSTLDGILDADLLFFLTGDFTATRAMTGWIIEYTTLRTDSLQTLEMPEVMDGDVTVSLLEPGDYLTSLTMRYEGELDLSHENNDVESGVIYLMKDIGYRRLSKNPKDGAEIRVHDDYNYVALTLTGRLQFDNCICDAKKHSRPDGKWQEMVIYGGSSTNPTPLRAKVYSTRKAALSPTSMVLNTTAVQNIVQGGSTSGSFTLRTIVNTRGPRGFYQGNNSGTYWCSGTHDGFGDYADLSAGYARVPWGEIHEAAYIELPSEQFTVDLDTTYFCGYCANSAQVVPEFVTVSGKRFLKLTLADGVVHRNYYQAKYDAGQKSIISDNLVVGFKSLPGTPVGDYHPVGTIYMDYAGLLDHYQAPVATGYDDDKTKWVFSGATEDVYGLSPWTGESIPAKKLFVYDGSGYTVHVDISQLIGASLIPGKNESYYPPVTVFKPTEEGSLNGLMTLKGPTSDTSSNIYDLESYVVLPRIGTGIRWADTVTNGDSTVTTFYTQPNAELSVYFRDISGGEPVSVIANEAGQIVQVLYTTDPIPAEYQAGNSAGDVSGVLNGLNYTTADQIANWRDVTAFKVVMPEMQRKTAVSLRLDLETDAKSTTNILTAYAGGCFRYRASESAATFTNGMLALNAWRYDSIPVSNGTNGGVFWDTFDENGIRTYQSNKYVESMIQNVKLTLYLPDGTPVVQPSGLEYVLTDANGAFTLYSYTITAGQYIVIEDPNTSDGSTPKLTKKSQNAPIQSAVDSDFDRDANKLTLGTLNVNGLSNISAGFVKLPEVTATDVTVPITTTADADAIVTEYVINTTYNSSNILLSQYSISFSELEDPAIATLTNDALVRNGTSTTQMKSSYHVTGLKAGETYCTVTVTNALGDAATCRFKITVAGEVTITAKSAYKTYDGLPLTESGYESTDLPDGFTLYSVEINGSATDVNTGSPSANVVGDVVIKNTAGEDVTSYFTVNKVNGTLTVNPAPLTVTTQSASKEYDGQPFEAAYFNAESVVSGLVNGETVGVEFLNADFCDVGSKPNSVKLTFADGTAEYPASSKAAAPTAKKSNYSVSESIGMLVISESTAEVKLIAPDAEKTYDGDPLTKADGVTWTGLPDGFTVEATASGSRTDAGESSNVVDDGYVIKNASGEDVTTSFTNVVKVDGKLTVKPAAVKITAESKEFTYDGKPHSYAEYKVEGLVGSDAITATVEGSITFPSESPVANEVKSHEFTSGKAGNYTVSYANGELTMKNASAAITITAASDEWTYDGASHENTEVKLTSGTLFEGDELAATATGIVKDVEDTADGNNPVAPGYKIMHGTEDVTSNYVITAVDGKLTVKPAAVKITAESKEFTYDGKPHSYAEYKVEGLVGTDAITATVEGSITFPSESPVANEVKSHEFTSGKAGNYTVSYANGELTMKNASAAITITAASDEWTYDGASHENTEVKLTEGTLFEGDELVAVAGGSVKDVSDTSDGNNPVAPGYKIMHGTEDVTANYVITAVAGKLTVKPAELTITTPDAEKQYDGKPFPGGPNGPFNAVVEGLVEGETVGITYLGMRHLNVGEYPNDIEISFAPEEIYFRSRGAGIAADGELPTAKAGNYTVVALSIGTLKITGWDIPVQSITIKAASGEKVYDGTPLTNGEYTVEGLPSGYTVEVTVEGSQTVTGSTPNKITGYVIRNAYGHVETGSFTVKTVNGTLTVKPAPLTVTADSAEKLYDGTPLVKDSYTSTALAEGDSFVSVTVTGSQTEPGTSANVASAAKIVNAGGEDVTFCYEIAYADGTLRVRDETEDIDDDDTPLGPGEDNVVEEPDEPIYNPNNVPSTGDGSNIPAWAGLSVLALIGLAVVSFRRRKKEDED